MRRGGASSRASRAKGHSRVAPARVRGAMALLALLLAAALVGGAQCAAPQRWKLAAPDASRDLLVAAPQGLARLAAYEQVRVSGCHAGSRYSRCMKR